MSNSIRTFEHETGDFATEPEIHEADTERGVDYFGDGNDDNDENDGWVMTFTDQHFSTETVDSNSVYPE